MHIAKHYKIPAPLFQHMEIVSKNGTHITVAPATEFFVKMMLQLLTPFDFWSLTEILFCMSYCYFIKAILQTILQTILQMTSSNCPDHWSRLHVSWAVSRALRCKYLLDNKSRRHQTHLHPGLCVASHQPLLLLARVCNCLLNGPEVCKY